MKKNRFTTLCAAALACALCFAVPAVAAESEAQTETAAKQQDESTVTAAARPAYKASDYVKISDEKYKNLTIRIDPPSDGSEEAEENYRKQLDTDLMSQLYTLYPVRSFPQDLVNYVSRSLTDTYRQYSGMYGIDFGTFLDTYLGMDEEAFDKAVKEAAQKTLKQELLLGAVAEKEGITVSDEEYQKGLEEYASRYGYASTDALLADFDEQTVRVSLLMDKTLAFLESVSHIEQTQETESETEPGAGTEADISLAEEVSEAETYEESEASGRAKTAGEKQKTAETHPAGDTETAAKEKNP